jgi:DNA-binding winged helix-turn-helix (wHTH) protein
VDDAGQALLYQAGDLSIDIRRQRVTRSGVEVALPRLSFALLVALAKAHPRMLTIDELLDAIWAPAVVNPETVAQRVKLLRHALGEDAAQPRYVVGVRGRGYRMDAQVECRVSGAAGAASVGDDPSSASSAGVEPSQAWVVSGRTWAVASAIALSALVGYWLASNRGTHEPTEAVPTALAPGRGPSIAGTELRITAELVDSTTGSRIWSQVYERRLDDVFATAQQVSEAVAKQIGTTLRDHAHESQSSEGPWRDDTQTAAATYRAYVSTTGYDAALWENR